jgi:murein DD-endopeptidase MepM/ murein hydrolase activator NlpD
MHLVSSRSLVLVIVALFVLFSGTSVGPAAAQEGETFPERPFQLPFAEPASPDTWLLAQPYGNTTGAYRRRLTTYGASGGIHFGVDLSAPCGTEIVAIADGVVFAVDGPFGSPPHNLMIDHLQLGYASMYGHLLEPPALTPGQRVRQGEVIAKVGDSGETCYSRPHLHLEIRDLAHIRKYNPATLIDANWDSLALTGSNGRDFARDLDEPRKWQSLYDQPQVVTGGPIVNDFSNPWPPDWEKGVAINTGASTPLASIVPAVTPSPVPDEVTPAVGRQLTAGDCCTNLMWSRDSSQVRFIDQPGPGSALGIWGVDVSQALPDPELETRDLRYYSPDEQLVAYPNVIRETTIIERLVDGQTWEIDTQGSRPSFSPDSQQIMWTVFDEDAPRDTRLEAFWLSDVDGSNARTVLSARRTDVVDWLSDDTLLLTRRVPGSSDETLLTLSLVNGRQTELVTLPEPRGMALSPDNRYLVYYVTFESNITENGLWLLDLADEAPVPQKLPFFGTYRWADSERLIYVPFDPVATEHNFFEHNVTTGENRLLFPQGTNLTIANNDWRVSPDGTKIALVEADGESLNGIWVLDISPVTEG